MEEIYKTEQHLTNPFSDAQNVLMQLIESLQSKQYQSLEHGDVEQEIHRQGFEMMRLLLQGHLNARHRNEAALDNVGEKHDYLREDTSRTLNSIFGKVTVHRKGYSFSGKKSAFPQDSILNLSTDQYSDGLKRFVADNVAFESFEQSIVSIMKTTATSVPNRQAQNIIRQITQDFDAFYEQQKLDIHSKTDILVLSCDGKGIVMRPDDLRPQTKKAADSEIHKKNTRLSKGEKRNRKRMATVASVYDIAPYIRTADTIMDKCSVVDTTKVPRPQHKRVWASVEKSSQQVIEQMFDEALRRDPQQQRKWVILVDGHNAQLKQIKKVMKKRKVHATICLDFIHVLEYLWKAAYCFHDEDSNDAEHWVKQRAIQVLNGKAGQVAGGISRSCTRLKMTKKQREGADICKDYLLNKKAYLKYDEALSSGYPIATGVIEGACRYLIKDRLDITGARWRLEGAEAMLKLRALIISGDFEEYFTFHKQQERKRNYPYYEEIKHKMIA
jgi:hypothetical protein